MTKNKCLGIYLDHSKAHLMEVIPGGFNDSAIESEFTHEVKEKDLLNSETHEHHAEHHLLNAYYKKIGDVIKNFQDVLLFGPTTAKNELANFLQKDHHFTNIRIEVKHAAKITENQQHAFVREHFSIKNV